MSLFTKKGNALKRPHGDDERVCQPAGGAEVIEQLEHVFYSLFLLGRARRASERLGVCLDYPGPRGK